MDSIDPSCTGFEYTVCGIRFAPSVGHEAAARRGGQVAVLHVGFERRPLLLYSDVAKY